MDDDGFHVVAGLSSDGLPQRAGSLHDVAAEQALNDLVHLTALSCEAPIAVISLAGGVGKPVRPQTGTAVVRRGQVLPFSAHQMAPGNVMVVPDARTDPRFEGHPLVSSQPGMVFLAIAPLVEATGGIIGALCIADYKAREFSESQCRTLMALAAQVMDQLNLRDRLIQLEAKIQSQSRYLNQLKYDQQELQKQNATDPLTGVGNRRSFHDRLCLEIARAQCLGSTVALMMLDVDLFKSYNDSFGHPAGDVVLKRLGEVMLRSCREEDFAARLGGEEFAILLPGTTRAQAFMLSKWLCRRVSRIQWPNRPVTISIGVAVGIAGESALHLTARADLALYCSKRDGRNRVTLADNFATN